MVIIALSYDFDNGLFGRIIGFRNDKGNLYLQDGLHHEFYSVAERQGKWAGWHNWTF